MSADDAKETRCGFCAIIGAPNAGKSTLVNTLAGAKVAIVSHKVQTTRARLRAIVMEGEAQIVLVDTPGIFQPRRKLDRAMVDNAWGGAGDADAVVLLVDGRSGLTEELQKIIEGLGNLRTKAFLVINKIDLMKREDLLKTAEAFNAAYAFERTFMVSALNGSGTEDLRKALAARMPKGPWLYPEDQVADVQLRFMASEITREKIYNRLHEELPYASTVETEAWEERKDGSVKISQVIYVERDSQKAIVLGKGGQTIKILGQQAREDMEEHFGRKVHLFLFVKVRENWSNDPERLRMMGLEL
ncbi:MAG: GTPase Era [Alphaproteobacteria bacterium]|jgi:GTP-binding protein Era|nr:GTPase Era [Alphaproteobacteria bacterium]